MFRDLAKTPPCGWNSWDCFGAAVNEKQLRQNAEYMAEHLKEYGWEYIVCDIQWYEPTAADNDYHNFADLEMDEYGRLIPAVNRFPSSAGGNGFRPLADYCHSLGLKFGIHILRGIPRQAVHKNTPVLDSPYTARQAAHSFSVCSWNTDMYGMADCQAARDYYNSVFKLYASWGVDFIKCDDISVTEFRKFDQPYSARHEIEMIRAAIDGCGRDMVLSLSPGPADIHNAEHLAANSNMWRLTGDFWDSWTALHDMFATCRLWQGKAREGNWPDCDMLPLGRLSKNGTCHGPCDRKTQFTHDEQITLMTLWGIFKSPLMFGGNLPDNDSDTLAILTNEQFMRMHRESWGAYELFVSETGGEGEIAWVSCGKGCKYLAVFNTGASGKSISVDLTSIVMPGETCSVYDIWDKKDIGAYTDSLSSEIPAHGAKLYKISRR